MKAPIGQHLLEVAHKNDIELEGRFLACTPAQAASSEHCWWQHCQFQGVIAAIAAWQLQMSVCGGALPVQRDGLSQAEPITVTYFGEVLWQTPSVMCCAGACEASLACSTCHVVVEVRASWPMRIWFHLCCSCTWHCTLTRWLQPKSICPQTASTLIYLRHIHHHSVMSAKLHGADVLCSLL